MRMRRANISRFALFKTFNFYRNENQFSAWYTLIPPEFESYSNRHEIINVFPFISKILDGVSYFVQYI